MGHTVLFRLNKDAREFQAGESTGFSISTGVKYYDSQEKTEKWTNYEAAVFARNDRQIQYYRDSLVAGNAALITGDKQAIRTWDNNGKSGQSIVLIDCKIGDIVRLQDNNSQAAQSRPQQQRPQPQQQYQQQQQQYQQPPQQNQGFAQNGGFQQGNQFDDQEIPFSPIGLQYGKRSVLAM